MVMLKDDGDIVKALGYVALYSAYMEEAIDECARLIVDNIKNPPKNFDRVPISFKLNWIKKWIDNLDKSSSEIARFREVLNNISQLLELRHEVIHGRIYSGVTEGSDVLRPSRKDKIIREVTSAELYNLAVHIFATLSCLNYASTYSLRRLIRMQLELNN